MGIINVWALEQDTFDENDESWCRGLGVDVKVTPLFGDVYMSGKLSHQVKRGLSIRLTTTCEKQETMLKLKYGHKLIHTQSMKAILPNESQKANC